MKKIGLWVVLGVLLLGQGKAEAYSGRLECKNLSQLLINFSGVTIKSYCKEALETCRVKELFDKTDPKEPLYAILKAPLESRLSLSLEICELAFLNNEPEYYARTLKRTS